MESHQADEQEEKDALFGFEPLESAGQECKDNSNLNQHRNVQRSQAGSDVLWARIIQEHVKDD